MKPAAFMAALLAPLAAFAAPDACLPAPGVDAVMARARTAAVHDVSYSLSIAIPDSAAIPVGGRCTISFCLDSVFDLPIDYVGSINKPLSINGCDTLIPCVNEHIVLPSSLLSLGRNDVQIDFTSQDKTLNRRPDYLYTLFVPANARKAFPCFDQPDSKASFSLSLDMPADWTAISNAAAISDTVCNSVRSMVFAPTEPLPTYLFSFVAGRFEMASAVRDGRTFNALYRETDPAKVAQLDEVFDIIASSLSQLEQYTGMPYPFSKYDFAIIPGYQFGGMEHPGAVQYNDRVIFLGENPTPAELLKRYNLLTHETAHAWFGDAVTMRWFDDVWTKEVFANFLADKITRPQYPLVDHDLNFLRSHYAPAYATDRTAGSHAIQQQLDNLNCAGLLYGNIIYHKAPIMMAKMEQAMGREPLRQALAIYLSRYKYGNADWNDLIAILDSVAPGAGMAEFDRTWVKEPSLPTISCRIVGDSIIATQADPLQRGLVWKQDVACGVVTSQGIVPLTLSLSSCRAASPCPKDAYLVIPNINGLAYGRFCVEPDDLADLCRLLPSLHEPLHRQSLTMTVFENWHLGNISAEHLIEAFSDALEAESDPLVATSLAECLLAAHSRLPASRQAAADARLWRIARSHPLPAARKMLTAALDASAVDAQVLAEVEQLWTDRTDSLLSAHDYMSAAYHLAVMHPSRCTEILQAQRSRISDNPDMLREFDFVSQACSPDSAVRRHLFLSITDPAFRSSEPWTLSLLALLCHKSRADEALAYIKPGLDMLPQLQANADIFFPGNFASVLLRSQTSPMADLEVSDWISSNPDFPPLLLRKILEYSTYPR